MEDKTRVHHKTVTEVSQGKHTKRKSRTAATKRIRQHYEVKVDPRVWKVAVRLSKGDPKRLKILSSTEVIVKNPRQED